MSCTHCNREATHYGRGHYVCYEHVDGSFRSSYFPIPV